MEFSRILREVMAEKELTNYRLAQILGVSRSTVGNWVEGKSFPDCNKLYELSRTLNVSSDYLLTGVHPIGKPSFPLDDDEKELIQDYRKLDRRGKVKISGAIYDELDRIERISNKDMETAQELSNLDIQQFDLLKRGNKTL